ncbi:MAG: adenylate/guanylate cyclase domain-containing protein [Treponema sp.]|nr:adenylate/guanylate cyclase domain-containing protein [Treponema sp.]
MLIITLLIVVSLGGVTAVVSYFVTKDIKINALENNLAINERTAQSSELSIRTAVAATDFFLDIAQSRAKDTDDSENASAEHFSSAEQKFFERNEDILAIYARDSLFVNKSLQQSHEITPNVLDAWRLYCEPSVNKAATGSFVLENASPFFGFPLMAIMYPGENGGVCILYDTERLGESFSGGSVNQSFFVNDEGDILIDADPSHVLMLTNEAENPVFKEMRQSSQSNAQITYRIGAKSTAGGVAGDSPAEGVAEDGSDGWSEGETSPILKRLTTRFLSTKQAVMGFVQKKLSERGEEYIGAYKKSSFGNGGVITTVKTAIILEGIRSTTRRNLYIMVAILALAMLIVYYFAKSLSVPLSSLTAVANEINSGNFNTELFEELKTRGKNEIAVLARSTQNERKILNMVSKLTNQGVTKAVITNKIDFEPHLKDITIFFSDIRGFTAISDGFKNRFGEKSAAEIIGFLNDYMSRMVSCISATGGVVDKFEGDAIMAAWGVLRNESLDWEKLPASSIERARKQAEHDAYIREDALSAIRACIAMRYSLMKYNKDALAFTKAHEKEPMAKYKPHIRIGAGLNSGRATVGFMGSYDKLEFTSIGDAVNFASRTEASNKPCGTDILITEDTLALLKHDFIRCKENNFTLSLENEKNELVVEKIPVGFDVKGKGTQHFYGVVNMPRFNIEEFFSEFEENFVLDTDCARAVGEKGPKTLKEMRKLLGIEEPNFGQVDLNAEENKIQVAAQ